ncbi:MAG: SDR family oxidoreductase [Bacteroidetes bacterium]|nr:SDR family oxidoreductase [Bacteroidota bacterium]
MLNILITGGAGYKGVILLEELLKRGHKVTVLDNFMYGHDSVLGFVGEKNCTLIRKDIRNLEKTDVSKYDMIYHLAGISGYPACEANPHSAQIINVDSTKKLVSYLSKNQVLVNASTTSFYGSSGEVMHENSPVAPVSLYGITKLEAERICMQHPNSVSFRFATLFGVSRKMRADLLVNDFVYKAVTERSLVLFDSKSIRTYLHVRDAVDAYLMITEKPEKFSAQIFNVGSNELNFSKLDLAKKIQEQIDFKIIDSDLNDFDKRNFIINYDKINSLGFKPKVSLEEGISELKKLYSFFRPYLPYQII